MGWFGGSSASGYSGSSTAEEVTLGIHGSGLTAVVTGASSGIGAETARVLALRGVHVVMAVRNISSANKVKDQILQEIPSAQVDVMELDLSSMASVRKFASDFKSSNQQLNILINNAGVLPTTFSLSEDNIELQFATNYLGHFLLTYLLLDTMKKTAHESGREGRIVNVSSSGHSMTYHGGICFDKLNDPSRYVTYLAYGQSKLANILHANELARRLKDDGAEITANSVHPGAVNTNFFRDEGVLLGITRIFSKFFFKGVAHGAATVCYVALHPQVNGVSGQYFSNCNVAKPSRQAQDITLAQKLWDFSIDLIK